MSHNNGGVTGLSKLMADIKKAAEIAGAPCQDDLVWDILNAYETYFLEEGVCFRITTKPTPELNVRYITLRSNDPYAVALEHGFLTRTDHPVHESIDELRRLWPDAGYLIDIGVTHGFEKIWAYFVDPLTIEEACALENMPPSFKNHMDLYKKYELNWVSVIGVDYLSNTMNPYFVSGTFPIDTEIAAQLTEDMGFPRPSEEDNVFNGSSFVMYPTFSWESDVVERVSFGHAGPQDQVPTHWNPLFNKFAKEVSLSSEHRTFTFNTCYGRNMPNYYKLEADYYGNIFAKTGVLVENAIKTAQAARQ